MPSPARVWQYRVSNAHQLGTQIKYSEHWQKEACKVLVNATINKQVNAGKTMSFNEYYPSLEAIK